ADHRLDLPAGERPGLQRCGGLMPRGAGGAATDLGQQSPAQFLGGGLCALEQRAVPCPVENISSPGLEVSSNVGLLRLCGVAHFSHGVLIGAPPDVKPAMSEKFSSHSVP